MIIFHVDQLHAYCTEIEKCVYSKFIQQHVSKNLSNYKIKKHQFNSNNISNESKIECKYLCVFFFTSVFTQR